MNQQNAVSIRYLPKLLVELRRWDQIAAFTLDGFDNNGGHLFSRQDGFK